jgi:hypothetical protein
MREDLHRGGDHEDAASRATELDKLLDSVVGQPITVANEFTSTEIRRIDTRNGSRLLVTAPRTGQWISLDALEVEALTRQNTATLAAMVGSMDAPLIPDGPDGEEQL